MDAMFEERVHRAGFTVLGWADVGFVYLYSKNPVTTTRELQSQKVWLWEGDPLAEAFLKAAGVSPVPLAITDVLTALQTGLVTTVYITPLANIAMQWFTRISYTTDVPLTFSLGAVVVTNAAFDAIPAQHQQVIRDCCRTYFDQLRLATSADNRESMEVIARHGVKSITPSADDLASFHRIGEQVQEALVGKLYDQALLDQLRTVLIEYRQGSGATGALSPGEAK
jgi:TRAP-type C4-dicarboxylate transport system substrate-binding protein